MEDFLNCFEQSGYFVFDSFLSQSEAAAVLVELKQLQGEVAFRKAGIGKQDNFQIDKKERGDFIFWIDRANALPASTEFFNKLDNVIQLLNRNFYLGIRGFESHYTEYPKGTFYKKHVDRHKSGSARVVSFVLYLNEAWQYTDGGQLRIYGDDNSYTDILPEAGKLAIFLSEKEHEVLLTMRIRNSITGWMLNVEL